MKYIKSIPVYFLFASFLICCNTKTPGIQSNITIDNFLIEWNRQTLLSLENNLKKSRDSSEKKLYSNRLTVFHALNQINAKDSIDKISLRNLFLKEAMKNSIDKDSYYIIETKKSGERIEINNFIVHPKSTNAIHLLKYNYKNGKWIQLLKSQNVESDFPIYFQINPVPFGQGQNPDDITITYVRNGRIIFSDYYLFRTLPRNSLSALLGIREL